MSTLGSTPPRPTNPAPVKNLQLEKAPALDSLALWNISLYEKGLIPKEALSTRLQLEVAKREQQKSGRPMVGLEVISRTGNDDSLESPRTPVSSLPRTRISDVPKPVSPNSNSSASSGAVHVRFADASALSSASVSSSSESMDEHSGPNRETSRNASENPRGKNLEDRGLKRRSLARQTISTQTISPQSIPAKAKSPPKTREELESAFDAAIKTAKAEMTDRVNNLRAKNLGRNEHESTFAKTLRQASSTGERKKIFAGIARPGAVIAIGYAANSGPLNQWESALSMFGDQLAKSPERFIVVVGGVPSAASRKRIESAHDMNIPSSLLKIEGLEIKGMKAGPLQSIVSNSVELAKALDDKELRKHCSDDLGSLLQIAVESGLLTAEGKDRIEKHYANRKFDKVKKSLEELGSGVGAVQLRKDYDSPLGAQAKREQIENLRQRYPERTIIVLDAFGQMHGGTRMIETTPALDEDFELSSEEALTDEARKMLKLRDVPGWVDGLKPELRQATYSLAMDATDDESNEDARKTAPKKSDVVNYGFSTQNLGFEVQKMHSPAIMLSSALLAKGDGTD